MTKHATGTREEWLKARLDLLKAEKALTHQGDKVAEQRQALPWVGIDKDYRFETEHGDAGLKDLFRGRSQLVVYHFMFGPDYKAGCPSCSSIADGFNGIYTHLEHHDVAFSAVSRAPYAKLAAYKKRLGWVFPWASSYGGEFNFDFNVSLTEVQQQQPGGFEYNYQRRGHTVQQADAPEPVRKFAADCGTDAPTYTRDLPGMSAFAIQDGALYHTYSTYARGLDALWGMYPWLDRAPLGRNEGKPWWKRHDEYDLSAA